jgi:hypothetical protein
MRNVILAAVALASCAVGATAGSSFSLSVTNPTFRVLPGGLPAAGYLRIHNHSDGPIVLMGARSPGCGSISIHRSTNTGGMSRMQMLPSLTIAVGERVSFEPNGFHLMCTNPRPSMLTDKKVEVTLLFDNNHSLTTSFYLTDARGVEHR